MDETPIPRPASSWTRRFVFCLAVFAWLGAAAAGLMVLWRYENTPGAAAASSSEWPGASRLAQAAGEPTLILLAHPQCSCTRATLTELEEVIARAPRPPKTYILFLKPVGFASGWEMTDLWNTASRLPGATVLRDDEGREASLFGARTSGQTVLYDADGRLVFSGGITGARGHVGENAGRNALVALLSGRPSERSHTWVFGCSLFSFGA